MKDSTVDSGQSDDSSDQRSDPGLVSVESPSSVELASLSERDSDVSVETRQKLNLWKCRQCREARKKVSLGCYQ